MGSYKIEYDRDVCIGTHACHASAEKFWMLAEDGKIDLANATFNEQTQKWELIIDEKYLEENKEAEAGCPVEAIKVIEIE